jgi:hypothetical protein
MPDLSPEQVRAQLASTGLVPVDAEDLDEVTHRLNAITEALLALEPAGLDDAEPMTVFETEDGAS